MESCAILQYLAEKYPTDLLPQDEGRWDVLPWLYWQAANVGPVFGNKLSYTRYRDDVEDALKAHPLERFGKEGRRLVAVLNKRLEGRAYVCGDKLTISDIALSAAVREAVSPAWRASFVQPLVVVVLDEASEGLHPRSPFAVHPVGTVPPLKRERRCGRLEPSWLPPCTWACDCLGRFSSPVTSSTLRCVGFAPPGERLAQTLPVDHRDRQPGSCRSLAGSCSYSRIADLRVLSRF